MALAVPDVLGELHRDGTLGLIYAHLTSMLVWQRMINESLLRAVAATAAWSARLWPSSHKPGRS